MRVPYKRRYLYFYRRFLPYGGYNIGGGFTLWEGRGLPYRSRFYPTEQCCGAELYCGVGGVICYFDSGSLTPKSNISFNKYFTVVSVEDVRMNTNYFYPHCEIGFSYFSNDRVYPPR